MGNSPDYLAPGIGGYSNGLGTIIINGGRTPNAEKYGKDGTFVSADGNAFIMASSTAHQDNEASWSGVIFEDNVGHVYGSPTLGTDAEIPVGNTLTIERDKTLTVGNNVTLTTMGRLQMKAPSSIMGQ